jgi:NarL family two-component system response regulator LiaR
MYSIFIVEDHSMTARGLAAFFTETGRWSITGTAASLEEAKRGLLAAGSVAEPGIILLDLQLADESGLHLIAWLREREGLKQTPVVVYSHFNDDAHRNAAIQIGAAAYVCKSQSGRELEDTLLAVMAGAGDDAAPEEPDIGPQKDTPPLETMLTRLTKRETTIFLLLREGLSARQIAEKLYISRRTVENHLSCIYDKTGMRKKDIQDLL